MNEKQKIKLNWPDVSFDSTNWESTILQDGKLIAFVSFHYDQDAVNPCEDWDGFGMIRSLSTKHGNNISIEEVEDMLQDEVCKKQIVALSYFEHGNCRWGIRGTMDSMADFNWDGVNFAGIWIPDSECIASVDIWEKQAKEKGEEFNRYKKFEEMAEQACKTYTAWCNGEVYGYRIELYRFQFDDDSEPIDDQSYYECNIDPLWEDSCWGFYDDDDMKYIQDTILESLNLHLNSMKKKAQFDSEGEPYYAKMSNKDFERILETVITKHTASQLIQIPGIYEVVSEQFNNEILEEWEKEQLK